ncbi:MAG: pilus assembly PilX N-terminal domain-containing protein [Planctomycetota bacterium]
MGDRGAMRVRNTRRSERGAALVLSLIMVMVVGSVGAAFLQLSAIARKDQSHSVDQMQAFYAAEAGLAEAFLAVRMGRTGRMGSAESPGLYGESTVWVDSVATEDGRVWLRSNARNGLATAALGLIIDPPDPPLGFFADEDIVIDSVLLVDGFDSTERDYVDEVESVWDGTPSGSSSGASSGQSDSSNSKKKNKKKRKSRVRVKRPSSSSGALDPDARQKLLGNAPALSAAREASPHFAAQRTAARFDAILGQGALWHVLSRQVSTSGSSTTLTLSPIDPSALLSSSEYSSFVDHVRSMYDAYQANALYPPADDGAAGPRSSGEVATLLDRMSTLPENSPERVAVHTRKGGALGSNGSIRFKNSKSEPVAIFGSVVPGVDETVKGLSRSTVSGSTEPRALEVDLERVAIPDVALDDPVDHDGLVPMVISNGTTGYWSISIAEGSELVLRGPAKIVVGELSVAKDARLMLDTRDGEVELFVVGDMSLAESSIVETTGLRPSEVSIRAAKRDAFAAAPRLELDSTGQFHGTIYAPESEVRIGTNFEVFGSVAARRLEIGAGARLHFDDETYNGELPVPTQESWRILDLPEEPEEPSGDWMRRLPPLTEMHDLEHVDLSVVYLNRDGAARSHTGPESGFDWNDVGAIQDVERQDTTPAEEAASNVDVHDWWSDWWDWADASGTSHGWGSTWGSSKKSKSSDGYSKVKSKDRKSKKSAKKKKSKGKK